MKTPSRFFKEENKSSLFKEINEKAAEIEEEVEKIQKN